MATKLERMRIDEVSGVDVPANLTDGWLLRKSVADAIDAPDTDESVLKRVIAWFRKAETLSPDSHEEIDMTQEELTAALEAQTEAIGKSVGEAVSAALEASRTAATEAEDAARAAAEEAAATAAAEAEAAATAAAAETTPEAPAAEATTETVASVSAEQFGELSERVEAIAKAVEAILDPVQALVAKSVTRTSLPEDAEVTPVAKAAAPEKKSTTGIFERLAAGETSVHIGRLVS